MALLTLNPRRALALLGLCLCLIFVLLMIPEGAPPRPLPAGTKPFAWSQPEVWSALEAAFLSARARDPADVARQASALLDEAGLTLASMTNTGPSDPGWRALETNVFTLATLVAVHPNFLSEFAALVDGIRRTIKRESSGWDVNSVESRETLYRLLYGSRLALEEVLLQQPAAAERIPPGAEAEPSQTPSVMFRGVRLHSGDLLVSRGDAPTSALISRGNDYAGAFSHVSLLHADRSGEACVIQALIEKGVVVTPLEAYDRDRKLRLMVLRPRSNLPALAANPLLPHQASAAALAEARARHIPYDFAMNHREHTSMFCSEVAFAAYESCGLRLWMGMSRISSPTLAAWLGSLGVRHFETQEPADLEYDPQLQVVAEWREVPALWQAHLDDAVADAMLDQAPPGRPLPYSPWMLPPARVAKAWSLALNAVGRRGPVPEGMSATSALRADAFKAEHRAVKVRLDPLAAGFRKAHGYSPPYWELVRMAGQALEALRRK